MNIFFEAVHRNDWRTIEKYLEAGGDIDVNEEGFTALSIAALLGNTNLFIKLVESGADIHERIYGGGPILIAAVGFEAKDIVRYLLTVYEDIEIADSGGNTALFYAANNGNLEILNMLIENGANIDAVDSERNYTPLLEALTQGQAACAKQLILKGANIQVIGKNNVTPLQFTIEHDMHEVSDLLIRKGCQFGTSPSEDVRTFFGAVIRAHTLAVAEMLSSGINANESEEENGFSPLFFCTTSGHEDIVKLLIKNGAQVNRTNKDGDTALLHLLKEINTPTTILKGLIETTEDLDFRDKENGTALMYASGFGNLELVKMLVSKGADINARDSKTGSCALMEAISNHESEVAIYLINNGADVKHTLLGGESLLIQTLFEKLSDVALTLIQHGHDVNVYDSNNLSALSGAAAGGYLDIVRELIKRGADINEQGPEGVNPLFQSIFFDHDKVVRYLLSIGADQTVINSKGYTPREYAAQLGREKIIMVFKVTEAF